ncbi:cell wall-associated NlpC family hydrolase [Dysgonomonas alginatilytica]|uniref:Cell wall-associated NlpC family hydrolase n=1 Tax=Dysgonomonas alginatilytica TaxID=1605892 RepID=A0A2V3PW48_9BACT|nr:C40 family peptidase [Dysgonomonas alginatilytica]PXV68818.1 cell wall-associated NlpC family hydrolase [Dysgonomonas alginatilytica]
MKYAIYLNTALPIRSEASEASEMVTQLLFGDTCEILEESGSFVKIKNSGDDYQGWADSKSLTEVDQETYKKIINHPVFRTCVPIADIFCMTDKTIYRLSAGSLLPLYSPERSNFEIGGKVFQIHPTFVTYLPESNKNNIIESAMLFLNTPYLWGGKNILGIDCSGFVQTVYAMNGFTLPRDAGMQALEGLKVETLEETQPNDLLFFEKEGRITHVGIYLGNNKIIHASGKVKIERVDKQGIYNEESDKYTHSLSTIKRV